MKRVVTFSLLFLLMFIVSCKENLDIAVKEKEIYNAQESETKDQSEKKDGKTIVKSQNDENDLLIEANKIIGVKNKNSLYSIVLTNNINEICDDAFENCFHLEWIVIPKSVKRLGKNSFYKCASLHTVVLENSEIGIIDNSFEDCYELNKIYFIGTQEELNMVYSEGNNRLENIEIIYCNSIDDVDICFVSK